MAYPHPTDEVYEERLFSVYDQAFPAAEGSDRLIASKVDAYKGVRQTLEHTFDSDSGIFLGRVKLDNSEDPSVMKQSTALPPKAYMIPGNHDWIDGLDTYTKQVLHRSSIGGWKLPQDLPYFAMKLPHGWWKK